MAAARKNPFKFGDPVEGDYYFARSKLTNSVSQFLDNGIHIALIGPRRFGKTSFILDMLNKQEAQGSATFFVDVFNVTSHRDFLQQMTRGIQAKKGWTGRLKKFFAKIRPKVDIDPQTGGISLTPALAADDEKAAKDVKDAIQDTVAALAHMGKKVVVAIDEFQKVAELDDQGWMEATLRTLMQQMKNTVFILSGSRKSIISDMLNNASRPFYRSCQSIEFPAFDDDFTDWIIDRFKSVKITCDKAAITELRRNVQDTPNYVQMACFHLVASGTSRVDDASVQEILKTIVKQNAYAYQTLLNSLTAMQQRALRLMAIEESVIYRKDVLRMYEIKSGPALASAVSALKNKQILDEGMNRGKAIFDDPLFAIWLRTEFSRP